MFNKRLPTLFGILFLGFYVTAQADLLGEETIDAEIQKAHQLMAQGKGVKAMQALRPQAQAGQAAAAYWLGRLYFYDEAGIKQDYTAAAEWFTRAAEKGHSGAQYKLGGMYFTGRGVEKDKGRAVQWWIAAARQHHAESLNNLGALLVTGQGVIQDVDLGTALQILAAESGSESARENLKNKVVSDSARALAQALAQTPEKLDVRLSGLIDQSSQIRQVRQAKPFGPD